MSALPPSSAAASFSPSDAAVSGFRFIGRRPDVIAIWTGIFLLYELIVTLLLITLPGDMLGVVRSFGEINQTNPEAALAMLPTVGFVLLVNFFGSVSIYCIIFTAAYRAFLTPSEGRRGYVKLGVDEFYMGCLVLLGIALCLGYFFLWLFVGGMLWIMGSQLPLLLKVLYNASLIAAAIAALVYPFVRLSLAMPMTFMDKHVRLIESWKATRGEFWSLLGAYLLAGILMFVIFVSMWSMVVIIAVVAIMSTGRPIVGLRSLFEADTSSLAAYLTPTSFVAVLLNAIASAIFVAVISGAVAEAYRALVGGVRDPSPGAPKRLQVAAKVEA